MGFHATGLSAAAEPLRPRRGRAGAGRATRFAPGPRARDKVRGGGMRALGQNQIENLKNQFWNFKQYDSEN